MRIEEVKTFIEIVYLNNTVWTTESYDRVPWQKTKNVLIGQAYNETA